MKPLLLAGLSLALSCVLSAQNTYHAIVSLNQDARWLRSSAAAVANPGEPVLLYQQAGAQMNLGGGNVGQISDLRGTGHYDVNRVLRTGGDTIYLALPVRNSYDLTATQLVLAPALTSLTVTEDQTVSQAFDGSRGGILFLAANDSLTVTASLSVYGAGFRGGRGRRADSDCSRLTSANDETYALSNWRGSPRGEGVATIPSGQESGRAPAGNGGGGGNDHNAGGGGGANVAGGGGGARNIVQGLFNNACRGNFPGRAGRGLTPGDDRLFFGGGGGAGHANNTTTASGGNGGGLIVLWAPYVAFGDDAVLDAGGADANGVDGDGGGGGGAGGSILLLADELTGRPNIDVSGGRGADVDNPSDRCFGPGGGGGGGRLFTSTRERGRFSPFLDAGAGGNGLRLNSSECDQNEEPAGTGIPGDRRDLDLVIPFGGIEFAMDTVCGGQTVRFTDRSSGAQTVAWLIEHPTVEDITFSTDDQGLDLVLPDSVSGTYTIYQQLFRDGEGYPGDTVTITTFPSAVVTGATIEEAEEVVTVRVNDPRGFDAIRYDFGDGTVIDTNVFTLRHTYTVGGDYSVAVTLLNANCGDLAVATEDIVVPEFAKALIDLKDAGGCAPYELNIASRSTGTFTELRWAFPGAFPATSTSTSPTVVYADTGRYLVTLTLNDGIGPDTVASIPVTVRFTPTADFSFTVDTATAAFTPNNPGADAYYWNFGDDSTSVAEAPTHTYAAAGTYTVTYTAATENCTDTLRREVTIAVLSDVRELSRLGVKLYPNPTTGLLTLRGPAEIVGVFDLFGRRVIGETNGQEIDLGGLPASTYLVRVKAGRRVFSLRVLKR